MIRIIDTYAEITLLFEDGKFSIDKWKNYINQI